MMNFLETNQRIKEAGNQTVISAICKNISRVIKREMVELLAEELPTLHTSRLQPCFPTFKFYSQNSGQTPPGKETGG